jgi:DNA-binding Lrp family transcriptional regulator
MPIFNLDEIDLKILQLLEADGRLTNVELARSRRLVSSELEYWLKSLTVTSRRKMCRAASCWRH